MANMSRFQLIFTVALIFVGLAGIVAFALSKGAGDETAPPVTLWGTLDRSLVSGFIADVAFENQGTVNVTYVQKQNATLESELVNALASGKGPDMVILPQEFVIAQLDKFYVIPFETVSQRAFKDAFVPGGELFLAQQGVIGLPFSVDPMVMYWNRTMFTEAGLPKPPTAWTQFFELAPKLTKRDASGSVSQSFVAFGETRNVSHATDMLSLLAIQAGTPIVKRDAQGRLASAFADRSAQGGALVPAEQAVSFFTEFSNPTKPAYSWNRSLPNDRAAFTAGKLAVYFGYASELSAVRNANPNLDFDLAPMPQAEGRKATFGRMHAIVILKSSRNVAAAFSAAATLTNSASQAKWIAVSGLPPVRRELVGKTPGDAYKEVINQSALIAQGWLEPDPKATDGIFTRMVESVTSGKLRASEAVRQASQEIDNLLNRQR